VHKSRRQIVNRIFEFTGISVVALNLLVFFAAYRPLGIKVSGQARSHAELRQTVRNQQARIELLRKFEAAMPQTGKRLEDFTSNRTPSRREGFSMAAHVIHELANASGVKVSTLQYRLDSEHHDPLKRLELEISAQGSYRGLLKFSHALETANDFILVRDFILAPADQNGGLGLRLDADLYLTP